MAIVSCIILLSSNAPRGERARTRMAIKYAPRLYVIPVDGHAHFRRKYWSGHGLTGLSGCYAHVIV